MTLQSINRRKLLKGTAAAAAVGSFCTIPSRVLAQAADTIVVGKAEEAVGWDPALVTASSSFELMAAVYDPLILFDDDGQPMAMLAESWEQPDDTTYVFDLRDDVQFQDGTPMTAEDVVFSLEQARNETASPGFSGLLASVDTIEQSGDGQVTIRLTKPDAAFTKNMSTAGTAFITSKAFWERHNGDVGTPGALLLGTGPYQVTEFVPDSHVSFRRADTWRGEAPAVQNIRVNFVPDESTRLVAAQSGDLDMAFNVPLAQTSQWEKLQTMRVDYVNDLSYVGLYFNPNIAPFDDPKVRETFAHLVDRSAYVDKLLRGHGEPATAIMTPESLVSTVSADQARSELATVPQWDYNLDAARAALAASNPDDTRNSLHQSWNSSWDTGVHSGWSFAPHAGTNVPCSPICASP